MAEVGRLVGTEAERLIPVLRDDVHVVVVEDGDQLVGCHVLFTVVHAECLWIRPDRRKGTSVARRLWAAVRREIRDHFHADGFLTAARSAEVAQLLAQVGAIKLDGDHYAVRLGGST